MTKRTEVLKFCLFNGLRAKGERGGGVMLSYDTRRTNMADWVDMFDTWDEAHAFLMSAVWAHRDTGKRYPWIC